MGAVTLHSVGSTFSCVTDVVQHSRYTGISYKSSFLLELNAHGYLGWLVRRLMQVKWIACTVEVSFLQIRSPPRETPLQPFQLVITAADWVTSSPKSFTSFLEKLEIESNILPTGKTVGSVFDNTRLFWYCFFVLFFRLGTGFM